MRDDLRWEDDQSWGLYDAEGRLIEAAAYLRDGRLVGQSWSVDLETLAVTDAPPGPYLYGGNMIDHFGHFLISTLSRYWLGVEEDLSSYKILCHGQGVPQDWWAHTFIRDIFSAVGLGVDNFVVFKTPTRLQDIIVPRSSAEEHKYVHAIYAQWCNQVGRSLLDGHDLTPNPRPIWFSKTKLSVGVQGLVNEADLTSKLSGRGVEIIYPEELSIVDQVKLYATRPVIMGTVGSAFHTSALWPSGAKLLCVKLYGDVNSNYAITDFSNRNDVHYIEAEVRPASESSVRRFWDSMELVNIDEVFETLVSMAGLQDDPSGVVQKISRLQKLWGDVRNVFRKPRRPSPV